MCLKVRSEEPESEEPNPKPFLCTGGPTRLHLGQLTAYATSILSAQYRTQVFIVFVVGDRARLIRWDRDGGVVTKKVK